MSQNPESPSALSLFDFPVEPPSQAVDTSEMAASIAKGRAKADRRRIFIAIHHAGGLTCDEVCVALEMDGNSARPRLWELAGQGLIWKSPVKRPTRTGALARVYQLTVKGWSVWRQLVARGLAA